MTRDNDIIDSKSISLSSLSSPTVTDTDVQREARTPLTAQPLILGFGVSLRSSDDLTRSSETGSFSQRQGSLNAGPGLAVQ